MATTPDEQVVEPIHAALAAQELLPEEHLVDAGYVDSVRIVESAQKYGVRLLGPAPADSSWQAEARRARRAEQQLATFKAAYAARAGVEGTISQGVRLGDLRRTRYRGRAKTALQHVIIAVALSLIRLMDWWRGAKRRGTRTSAFAALAFRSPPARAVRAG